MATYKIFRDDELFCTLKNLRISRTGNMTVIRKLSELNDLSNIRVESWADYKCYHIDVEKLLGKK